MKNIVVKILGCMLLIGGSLAIAPSDVTAQRGILKRTMDKFKDQAAEEISDALVSVAMRPVRKGIHNMLREKYKEKYGEEFDDSKYENDEEMQKALYESLYGFYGNVELPEEYVFLYEIDYEFKDENEKEEYTMLLNPEGKLFGIRSEHKGQQAIMVFDYGNDIMATFDLETKECLAFKHVMSTAVAMSANVPEEDQESWYNATIKPLSKKKKYADCQCQGFAMDSEDEEGEIFLCNDLPFDWHDMYGGMIKEISPGASSGYPRKDMQGVPFYVKTKDKETKVEQTMKAKKWRKEKSVIKTGEYKNQFSSEQ